VAYQTLIVEVEDRVMTVRLNRPDALNALNMQLLSELGAALSAAEADPHVGAVVLTGSEKAFAAGADVKEMAPKSFVDMFAEDFFTAEAGAILRCRKPVIAAVAGYCLGGGCELAMMCDFIIAADTAKFGQPEINLGIIPGLGGSQRLTRAVGKSKAMEMVLTGRLMDAAEAERSGLVSRVVAAADLVRDAQATAAKIAGKAPLAVRAAKEAVNRAFESTLAEGLLFERRLFHALFATADQKEGMAAFAEKRTPQFDGR
jgi:enoyl-CoA hydratase